MITKIKFPKPDYKFWARSETWSLNQSALLLHAIDPHHCRSVRLAEKEISPEFEQVQKTYFLLRSIPWRERHTGYYFPNLGVHPIAIIFEAINKNIRIPAPLRKLITKRYQQEIAQKQNEKEKQIVHHSFQSQENIEEKKPDQPFLNREKKNLLKGIAILVQLLVDEKKNYANQRNRKNPSGNDTKPTIQQ